jgi:hypothetical protein
MTQAVASKWQVLQAAGYAYSIDRMVYYNRTAKKAFSAEFVEDHTEADLQKCIDEDSGGTHWRFYFNSPPAGSVARELEIALG